MSFRVYVDGQVGLPFDSRQEAEEFAEAMRVEGYDAAVHEESRDEADEGRG